VRAFLFKEKNFYWFLAAIFLVAIGPLVSNGMNAYFFSIVMYAGINIILAVSLNLVNGFTGQFSIGHAGFMSVGGYVASFLSLFLFQNYSSLMMGPFSIVIFLALLIISGLCSAAIGYCVGLPSLKLKGDYLAIVTLGFGEIIRVCILNIDAVGGARGMFGIPAMTSFSWVFLWVVITLYFSWRILRSSHGREFLSVREDEIAASAMGVNTTRAKVRAFVMASFFAGVAGALYAHYLRYLNPQTFDFNKSFEIVIMVVLGGMGSLSGSVVAAILLTVLKEALRPLQEYTHVDLRMVIYSLLLIILMLTKPNGLFGRHELYELLLKKFKRKPQEQSS
jgi:branched-chain amino acid transport system permease protein